MSDDDFDWSSNGEDSDSIVVNHQPAIAVYLNPRNEVVIRQEGHYGPDEDQFVFVTKDNVTKFVQAILEAAGFESATTYGEPLLLPKPEPLSGAQRQKRFRNKHRNENGDDRVTESDELPLRLVTPHQQKELAS
jgi:hypothetical protein